MFHAIYSVLSVPCTL